MNSFEAFADDFEGVSEPLVERTLQLLIDGDAHLFELLTILSAQYAELVFHTEL